MKRKYLSIFLSMCMLLMCMTGLTVNVGADDSTVDYTISIEMLNEHGSAVLDKTTAKAGETVTLTLTPDEGYQVDYSLFTISNEDMTNYIWKWNSAVEGEYTFTMPDYNVLITVGYTDLFYVGHPIGDNFNITVDKEKAGAGETVTVTVTADEGYRLYYAYPDYNDNEVHESGILYVTDSSSEQEIVFHFTMPASNVIIAANTISDTIKKVLFDSNGGLFSHEISAFGGSDITLEEGEPISKAIEGIWWDYVARNLKGWSTDPDTYTPVDPDMKVTEDITLYAFWESEEDIWFYFDPNGGFFSFTDPNNVVNQISYKINFGFGNTTTYSQAIEAFTKQGYSLDGMPFIGWSMDPDIYTPIDLEAYITPGTTIYAFWEESDLQYVQLNVRVPAGLQAVIEIGEIKYSYDGSGTYGFYSGEVVNFTGDKVKISVDNPKHYIYVYYGEGYNYCLEKTYGSEFPIVYNGEKMRWIDVAIYAYDLIMDLNGGTAYYSLNKEKDLPITDSVSYRVNLAEKISDYTSILTDLNNGEKIFKGWSTTKDTYTAVDLTSVITADTTLYAWWAESNYTVTFDSDGGSAVTAQTVDYNGTATKPTAPTKTGYTFKEWQLDGAAYDFTTAVTKDITLKAVWLADTPVMPAAPIYVPVATTTTTTTTTTTASETTVPETTTTAETTTATETTTTAETTTAAPETTAPETTFTGKTQLDNTVDADAAGNSEGDIDLDTTVTVQNKSDDGAVENTTDEDANLGGAALRDDANYLKDAVLTPEDKAAVAAGETVDVYLEVQETTPPAEEQQAITQEVEQIAETATGDVKVGFYFDASLFKKVGSKRAEPVHETNGLVTVSFEIPTEFINTDPNVTRTYSIARLHNGIVTILPCKFSITLGTLSFMSDEFSTYALIYEDTVAANEGAAAVDAVVDSGETNPNTGSPLAGMGVFAAMSFFAAAAAYTANKRKNK